MNTDANIVEVTDIAGRKEKVLKKHLVPSEWSVGDEHWTQH